MSDADNTPVLDTQPPAKRRWGKIVLTLSLALNLLFMGAIVGAGWMRNKHHGSNWQGPPDFVVNRLLRHLPDDKRVAIIDQIKVHRAAMRDKFKQTQAQKQHLNKALKSAQFDKVEVRKAAASLKIVRQDIIDAKTDFLVNVLGQLTPNERREILDSRLFRHLLGRRGKWGARHH